MKTTKLSTRILACAVTGLLTGATLTLTSCGAKTDASAAGKNGCSGPNGCGADAKKEANKCAGANGCNGKHDEKKDANACSGHNGCKAETKK
jgi:hypothetical protein